MTLIDNGINTKGRTEGQFKTTCPKCSEGRRKKKEPCLSVNIDEGIWNCHHCGWFGSLNKKSKYEEYVKPEWNNNTLLSDKLVKWFNSRGIRQKTLIRNKITEGVTFMPQVVKEVNTIQFNYFEDNELLNIKYRDANKNFKLVKGAVKILYGLDDIKNTNDVIIVEGEMDKLSYEEAGFTNCVSVPNGANIKMDYLDTCKDYFKDVSNIFISTDNDEKGIELEKELSRRLGRDRCYKVSYPEGCKDANDVLVKYNLLELEKCILNAKPYPLEGVVSINNIDADIDRLYENGLSKGLTVGHGEFDNMFSFISSQLTVITGIPTHG